MKISVIIPALNEAPHIGELVSFIRRYGAPVVTEILVVDAGSSDDTCQLAEAGGAGVISCPIKSRAVQMNMGARLASGELLYFVHADVQLVESFALDIREAVQNGYAAGCFRYVFDSKKVLLRVNSYCTRFDTLLCRGGDQTLFIRTGLFRSLGGYDERYCIMEDYDLISRIRNANSFRIIPINIRVSARKYDRNSWLRVQLANLLIFSFYLAGVAPHKMKQLYGRLLNRS